MPIPLAIAGAAIGGASNMQTSAMNMAGTAMNNYIGMRYNTNMYKRQYADNIAFWRMQNEYNSPQAQMNRFQEAGLNPNLIYGQGNAGNAGPISTPDVLPNQSRPLPIPDAGSGLSLINSIYDLDIKQAQIDNLKAQNAVIQQDALLRAAQVKDTNIRGERGAFDLDFESELRNVSADARREKLRQVTTQTDIALQENIRREILTAKSVEEAGERILNMQAQRPNIRLEGPRIQAQTRSIQENIELMKKDGVLKQLDIELRRMGINPQDPTWQRIVGRVLNNAYDSLDSGKSLWDMIFENMFK